MAEAALRKVVVFDFADELGPHGNPFTAFFAGPSTRPARHAHLEWVFILDRFELLRQIGAIALADRRRVADVHESSFVVVEAEEERADGLCSFAVAESADDAIGGLEVLDLYHSLAIAGVIRLADPLGHHAVESERPEFVEPLQRDFAIGRGR